MYKQKMSRVNGLFFLLSFLAMTGLTAFAGEPVPVNPPTDVATDTVSNVTESPKFFFVGLQPQDKLLIQGYLIDALHFAHNSYGYVSWSMRAARRNLQEPLFQPQLSALESYIGKTILLADMAIRQDQESKSLPEIKKQFAELNKAVKLMLEGSKNSADATEPGEKVIESGKIHEQIGKVIPTLLADFQKSMVELASTSAGINQGQ